VFDLKVASIQYFYINLQIFIFFILTMNLGV